MKLDIEQFSRCPAGRVGPIADRTGFRDRALDTVTTTGFLRRQCLPFRALVVGILTLFFAQAGWALDLDAARDQGLVGEQPDGLLGSVQPTAEVQRLVDEVNQKRREAYAGIAAKNKLSLDQVGKLSAKKLIEKAEPQHLIQVPGTGWVRKQDIR